MSRRNRGFLLVGLLVALLVAGVGSYYASSSPDGLEWSAEEEGFGHTAEDSGTADSPLADYAVTGVDDGRLSGGLAGVIGVAVTLALAGGLTMLLHRRGDATPEAGDAGNAVDAPQPAAADRAG